MEARLDPHPIQGGITLLIALPTCEKDFPLAADLLRWCAEVEPAGYQTHSALIVAGAELERSQISELVELAEVAGFRTVTAIQQRQDDDQAWPTAPNRMFQICAQHVRDTLRLNFFWMEPDVTPLCAGWLTELEKEYTKAGKPFMGFVWDKPNRHLTGCAVYPPNVAKFNPHMLNSDRQPFDTIRPDLTLRQTHVTRLIHHEWGDIESNTPWTFPDSASTARLSPDAVLFHRCKDGSLIDRLRERKNDAAFHPELMDSPPFSLVGKIRRNVIGLLARSSTYYHSGNLGDIIYALKAIKLAGGGKLLIGPVQYKTSPCRVPITRAQFEALDPLLSRQEYVTETEYRELYPAGEYIHDLNRFRDYWNDPRIRKKTRPNTLARMHGYAAGVLHLFDDQDCWLSVPAPMQTGMIIVHRSSRYLSADFPWQRLVEQYHQDMLFVGLEEEYRDFAKRFGRVSFWRVQDLLEMARVIAGGRAFIGNQSSPCSIALACGQPVLQECWQPSPDCVFDRPNFCTQTGDMEKWEREYL